MLSLREFIKLDEANQNQQRVNKHLDRGEMLGMVSAERGNMDASQRKKAGDKLARQLNRLRKRGKIGGYSGRHDGRYQYADPKPGESGIAAEKSFLAHSKGRSKTAKQNFKRSMKTLAQKHGQESYMTISPGNRRGRYKYTKGKKSEDSGKISYNQKLTTGGGDTKLKGSGQSFTTK